MPPSGQGSRESEEKGRGRRKRKSRRERGETGEKRYKATNGYRGERKRAREKGRNCVTSYLKATSPHEVPRRIAPVQSFGVQTPARPRGHKPEAQDDFLRTPYFFFWNLIFLFFGAPNFSFFDLPNTCHIPNFDGFYMHV